MDSPASSSQSQPVTPVVKDEKRPIKLHSPYGATALSFQWQKDYEKNGAMDIYDNIRLIFGLIPEIKEKLEKLEIFQNSNITSYDWIRAVSKKFNKVAQAYYKDHSKNGEVIKEDYATPDLLKAICTRSYNRAVDDEKKLNKHYEAFSSQTYGETSYERLRSIIEEIGITDSDIFVDLGSGVGQLVVQMAGGSKIKRACGIEVADLPSKFATKLEHEFKGMMKWFGRKYRPFQIHHGDFLDDKFRQLITNEATIIFINNYAFTADLESNIKTKLLYDLKHGTKIISSKPYAPINKKAQVTQRTLNDLSAILDVTELKECPNPCSWTSNNVPYYYHVINRTKLEAFFETKKITSLRLERSGTPSSKSSSISRETSCAPSRNGSVKDKNGDGYGPTTRRKWNQIVTEMEQSKKKDEPETPKENFQVPSFRSPTPVDVAKSIEERLSSRDANIADTIDSVAGGTAASLKEFTSPIKKRPRKEPIDGKITVRGRPRKNTQPQEKKARISQEAREGMDIMHQLTTEACSRVAETFADPSFILTDVKTSTTTAPVTANAETPASYIDPNTSQYPALERFLQQMRVCFVDFFQSIAENPQDIIQARREEATVNKVITSEGVARFKAEMAKHGVDLEKPKDLLTRVKKYVTRYQGVNKLAEALQREFSGLEESTEDMISAYSLDCQSELTHGVSIQPPQPSPSVSLQQSLDNRVEEFAQPSLPGFPNNSAANSSLQSTIRSIQQSFNNTDPNAPVDQVLIQTIANALAQNPNLLSGGLFGQNSGVLSGLSETPSLPQPQQPSTSSLYNPYLNLPAADLLNLVKAGNLPTTLPDQHASSLISMPGSSLYMTDTSRASTTAPPVAPGPSEIAPQSATSVASLTMPSVSQPPPTVVSLPSTSKEQPSTASTSEAIVNGTTSSSKKPRSRSIRVPSNKKTAPPKNPDDPVKQEEIDATIKNIVQIALQVDKSAKSQAEKDRKARNSEKRAKEKLSNGAPGGSGAEHSPYEHKTGPDAAEVAAIDNSNLRKASKPEKQNKTFPTISMVSPTSHSKKRLSTDIPLPASSLAMSGEAGPATTSVPSSLLSSQASMSSRPIIPGGTSVLASSPLYPMQQLLTPTASVATSSNTVFPMDVTQQNDFLNLLNQTTAVKENDAMQMLLRNMNGLSSTQHLMTLLNGLNNFPPAVSSAPTAINNNNNEALQEFLIQQFRRNLTAVPSSLPLPTENDTRSVNSQSMPQQSDVGQF